MHDCIRDKFCEDVDKRLREMEITVGVHGSNIKEIKDDIKDVKATVKETNNAVKEINSLMTKKAEQDQISKVESHRWTLGQIITSVIGILTFFAALMTYFKN